MPDYKLILGNKRYSSWSLRGWLAAEQAGIDFEEEVILLRQPDTRDRILAHNAAGQVPVLVADGEAIWDSLAIAEYLAERFPDRGLWPGDPSARRLARCVVAEMHSGFRPLRMELPMNLGVSRPGRHFTPEALADIDRVQAIWRDCRQRFGAGGDFLFGDFCLADAFYAPVATRFLTYEVALDEVCTDYCKAIMAWPAMQIWAEAAAQEDIIADYG